MQCNFLAVLRCLRDDGIRLHPENYYLIGPVSCSFPETLPESPETRKAHVVGPLIITGECAYMHLCARLCTDLVMSCL